MRIAVVSDTHGHTEFTRSALELIRTQSVAAILHCGDIGAVEMIPLFADWPTHFVFGNCDFDAQDLTAAIESAGQTCHGRFGDLTLEGVRIALLHSDDVRRFRETIRSGVYDLVCYGHTHVARREQFGKSLVLNPGALYRANPRSFAIVDLPALDVTTVAVE